MGTVRPAVLEGSKNTLLTDNYIRLGTDINIHSICNAIVDIRVALVHGRPWAVPAKL
jgi:hypothetical protein